MLENVETLFQRVWRNQVTQGHPSLICLLIALAVHIYAMKAAEAFFFCRDGKYPCAGLVYPTLTIRTTCIPYLSKKKKKTIFWVGPSSCLVSVLHEAIMFRHYCLCLKSQTSYDNFLIFNRCLISARKLPSWIISKRQVLSLKCHLSQHICMHVHEL